MTESFVLLASVCLRHRPVLLSYLALGDPTSMHAIAASRGPARFEKWIIHESLRFGRPDALKAASVFRLRIMTPFWRPPLTPCGVKIQS
jgi:hypothetical protein